MCSERRVPIGKQCAHAESCLLLRESVIGSFALHFAVNDSSSCCSFCCETILLSGSVPWLMGYGRVVPPPIRDEFVPEKDGRTHFAQSLRLSTLLRPSPPSALMVRCPLLSWLCIVYCQPMRIFLAFTGKATVPPPKSALPQGVPLRSFART